MRGAGRMASRGWRRRLKIRFCALDDFGVARLLEAVTRVFLAVRPRLPGGLRLGRLGLGCLLRHRSRLLRLGGRLRFLGPGRQGKTQRGDESNFFHGIPFSGVLTGARLRLNQRSRSVYARTRRALVPISLRPTRDFERTSMRLPVSAAVTLTAMSSLKPNHFVVSTASSVPAAASRPTLPSPSTRPPSPPARTRLAAARTSSPA